MKKKKLHIILIILIVGLLSCIGTKKVSQMIYIGNFEEKKYDFFESFGHVIDIDFYYKLPFDLKFGGIRPFPYDSIGEKSYSWLRNPKNLKLAFSTFESIGLDKFVSFDQYNKPNTDWCCDLQWENKTLNDIVKGFIQSDTSSQNSDYYSKFWQRRKNEGNLTVTYQIFIEIDNYYNGKSLNGKIKDSDTILQKLLVFDLRLIHSDSIEYTDIALNYFDYLKSVKLDYSAYKLIFHNPKIKLERSIKDSLIQTLEHDTITKEQWYNMNDNRDGWISWVFYHDPDRYYGP